MLRMIGKTTQTQKRCNKCIIYFPIEANMLQMFEMEAEKVQSSQEGLTVAAFVNRIKFFMIDLGFFENNNEMVQRKHLPRRMLLIRTKEFKHEL